MEIEIKKDFEIKNLTTFKIGGKIKKLFLPSNIEELIFAINSCKNPLVLGSMSNVLISDFGIEELILTSKMQIFEFNENIVTVQAGVKGTKLALEAQKRGLSGLEFLIGFPATTGGAIYMNASSSQWISDVFKSAKIYDLQNKKIIELNKEQMKFGYRTSILKENKKILLEAKFELTPKSPEKIKNEMNLNLQKRKQIQPNLSVPNVGSIFKNPENQSAGKLLDQISAKFEKEGKIEVFENHANFIINKHKNGTAKEVLKLMTRLQDKVQSQFGIKLMPEIEFIGIKDEEDKKLWEKLIKPQE